MSTALSLDEEARLYTTNPQREKYESLATLYGIIVALDYVERAYIRDGISAEQCVALLFSLLIRSIPEECAHSSRYSPACTRLLSQYKTMQRLVSDDVPSLEQFMARYKVSKPNLWLFDLRRRNISL